MLLDKLGPRVKEFEQLVDPDLREAIQSISSTSCLSAGNLAANALAWQIMSAERSELNFHLEPLLAADCALARCALEARRPTVSDLIDRVHGDVLENCREIQLPLILATAISKISKPTEFLDILADLRDEYSVTRKRFNELEQIIAEPYQPKSARAIRQIYADLSSQLRRAAGVDSAPPALLEEVPSFVSLEPASILGSIIRLARNWIRPELRLLGRWTKALSFDTVGRLRSIFRTSGAETGWTAAAAALQQWGAVSWYPGRRLGHERRTA